MEAALRSYVHHHIPDKTDEGPVKTVSVFFVNLMTFLFILFLLSVPPLPSLSVPAPH